MRCVRLALLELIGHPALGRPTLRPRPFRRRLASQSIHFVRPEVVVGYPLFDARLGPLRLVTPSGRRSVVFRRTQLFAGEIVRPDVGVGGVDHHGGRGLIEEVGAVGPRHSVVGRRRRVVVLTVLPLLVSGQLGLEVRLPDGVVGRVGRRMRSHGVLQALGCHTGSITGRVHVLVVLGRALLMVLMLLVVMVRPAVSLWRPALLR